MAGIAAKNAQPIPDPIQEVRQPIPETKQQSQSQEENPPKDLSLWGLFKKIIGK
jgi:hypothetical protein